MSKAPPAKKAPAKAPARKAPAKTSAKHKTKSAGAMAKKPAAKPKAPAKAKAPAKPAKHTAKRTLTLHGKDTDQEVQFGRTEPYARWERPRLIIDHYIHHGLHYTTGPVDRASKVTTWPMYGNDTIGDCTCATVG
jgi:hypothetical protein